MPGNKPKDQKKDSTEFSTNTCTAFSSNTVLENACHFRLPMGLKDLPSNTILKQEDHY